MVRIEGEAGIGKSHLTATFAEQAQQDRWRIATGFCQSTTQDISYYPWIQIFRALVQIENEPTKSDEDSILVQIQIDQISLKLQNINPDWLVRLPLLGDLLDFPIPDNATTAAFDPRLRQEALFTLAVDLIQYWATEQPLILMLEDVHWIDEASQGLTLALARVIEQSSGALILVQRPALDENRPVLPELERLSNSHHLDLAELSPKGVAVLVAHRLVEKVSELVLDLIQVQAKGNPFFVEELIATLRDHAHIQQIDNTWVLSETIMANLHQTNSLIRRNDEWTLNPTTSLSFSDLGLPDSVHGLVLSRLDRLPETHKLTLKVASVIGRVFEFQLLAHAYPVVIDEESLLAQIEQVTGGEFVRLEKPVPELAHIFKHNITRDVAYNTLLEQQQQQLHQMVAEAIERLTPEAIEQLAYHYSRAQVRDKMLIYLDKAAQKNPARVCQRHRFKLLRTGAGTGRSLGVA